MALTAEPVTGKPFSFARLAQMLEDQGGGLQEGAVGAGDVKVTQRAAGGANMSVDVAVGQAWVEVDSGVRQGLRHVVNDAVANAVVTASHATLPRIDLVVLQYNDTAIPAGVGGDVPTIRVIAGIPTAGATLDNAFDGAHGAPALPADAMLLAHFLVPAASTSVTNANIRDRRKWARGAYRRIVRHANAAGGQQYTMASQTFADIDTTNLGPRIECSGVRLRVTIDGFGDGGSNTFKSRLTTDGVTDPDGGESWNVDAGAGSTSYHDFHRGWELAPAAGSHIFRPQWAANVVSQTLTLYCDAIAGQNRGVSMVVEEILRQDADNT